MSRWLAVGLVLFVAFGVAAGACGGGGGDKKDATKAASNVAASGTPSSTGETPKSTAGTPPNGSSDATAIEALVRRQTDANNNKDIDAFVGAFSDSYYDGLGVSRDDARALVATFIGVPQVEITKIWAIDVSGDNAMAEVDSNEGVIVSYERYSFVRVGGQWRIAKIEELPVEVGAARSVDLRLVEYNFEFDDRQTKDGGYAFNVKNAGAQPHEVELMKLPRGVTAEQLKDRGSVPAGVETIGLFGPLRPGETRTLAFASKLTAGHYALVCYLSDPNGRSYAALGMVKDLIID